MNILQIVPHLDVGGVETGTVDLAKYLHARGHKCIVVSDGGGLVQDLESCGIRHYHLPVSSKAFWVMLRASKKLAEILVKERVEVVHARSRVPAWVAFFAVQKMSAMFITTAHGYYSRHIFSSIMGSGHSTIVPSSVVGRHMMDAFDVPRENIRLIPRSVDLARFTFRSVRQRPPSPFRIGLIGRISPIKGQAVFLKAMHKLVRLVPSAQAWIVGGVSPGKAGYMDELQAMRRRLALTGCVEFLGRRTDIPEILSQLHVLVMTSVVEEAFGRVIIEAQAAGVPVVATKVGGVVEIIEDGRDGLLVYPKDTEGLVEAILRIRENPKLAEELTLKARKNVQEKFALERMAEETLKVYTEALASPRILVIKLSAVGDALLSVPSFEALRKKFPHATIVCLTGPKAQEVFRRCAYIDELIVYDGRPARKGVSGFRRVAMKIMRRRFDFCLDLQNNKKSHLLAYLSLSQRRFGYANGKMSFFLNEAVVDTQAPLGPVAHQFRVLEKLGIHYAGERLRVWPSEEDRSFARSLLGDGAGGSGRLVGLNIGASPRWESKKWLPEYFAALCDRLEKKGFRILLTGTADDAAAAQLILKKTKARPICVVARTTLMQLACLIESCSVYLTSDSAPLHVAAAVGTPFVALFGPTDPRRHLPPAGSYRLLQDSCSPCYKSLCPKDRHSCMANITVDAVLEAMDNLLQGGALT